MKKIRLNNLTEVEIYDISDTVDRLSISILNADSNAMEELFSNADNTSVIQYYVGTELMKGYAGYTELQGYNKKMNQTISTDYTTTDASTESGFVETKADIFSVTLTKPAQITIITTQVEQNTANIDYVAMETGVEL